MEGRIIIITPEETTEILRSYGMIISPQTLREGIEQKVFPFGECVKNPNNRGRRFFIYKVLLDKWMNERLCKEAKSA